MRAENPSSILSSFFKENSNERALVSCPAIKDCLANVYGIKSIYDYEFNLSENKIWSNMYNQEFFDSHVFTRSLEKKLFSFTQRFIFFTEEQSLNITGNFMPYMENSVKNYVPIPGTFDIGKWFRPIEFAFFIPREINFFKISLGEIYQYVQFHTENKINFVQFRPTNTIHDLVNDGSMSISNKKYLSKLDYFYSIFKLKKLILKEIKENIL